MKKIVWLLAVLLAASGCAADGERPAMEYAASSIRSDIPVPKQANERMHAAPFDNPSLVKGARYELRNIGGEQGLYPPGDYLQKLEDEGWKEAEDERLGHTHIFEKDGTRIAVTVHEHYFDIYEMAPAAVR